MLRRLSFGRYEVVWPPPAPLRPATRRAVYASAAAIVVLPKHIYIRSPKLLAAVRKLPCQHTGLVGQTEPAHSNWACHGKGGAVKADDTRVAAIAASVHRELDQGVKWTERERQAIWWRAHVNTVRELLRRDLWPARVLVPDIDACPFDLQGT